MYSAFIVQTLYQTGGVPTDKCVWIDILGNDTSRGDHRMLAYGNARHHLYTLTKPCTVLDDNRLAIEYHQVIEVVVGSEQLLCRYFRQTRCA